MREFLLNVAINIIANFVSWLMLGTVAIVALLWSIRSRRRALFRFFGINPAQPTLTAYLTSLNVQPGGAKRVDGQVSKIWEGQVISATSLQNTVTIPPIFVAPTDTLPPFVRRWLSSSQYSFEPVQIVFKPSPLSMSGVSEGPLLCLTTPNYNLASKYALDLDTSYVELASEYRLRIKRGNLLGRYIEPSEGSVSAGDGNIQRPAYDLALVSRITDPLKKRTIIYAAGFGSNGSRSAQLYLVDHWRELDKRFGTQDFAVILECPNRRHDPEGYKLMRIVQLLPIE